MVSFSESEDFSDAISLSFVAVNDTCCAISRLYFSYLSIKS